MIPNERGDCVILQNAPEIYLAADLLNLKVPNLRPNQTVELELATSIAVLRGLEGVVKNPHAEVDTKNLARTMLDTYITEFDRRFRS